MNPDNPADLGGWPFQLPLEIALRVAPAPTIFKAYGLEKADYDRLCADPAFRAAVKRYADQLAADGGMSFKLKAQMQAEELLEKTFELTHASYDKVPPAVQADVAKFVIRAAGFDGSKDQASNKQSNQLQININLA